MLRKISLFFAAVLLASSPSLAQGVSEQATVEQETAEQAPAPAAVAPEENILYLDLSTGGRVAIQLFPAVAPNHVERIKTLARQGFYNGVIFHRVIDGFMAQTGDPTGTGTGGSDLPDLKAEFHPFPHLRGVVSMARAQGEDSANSQFFIVFYPRFALDNKYTVFGRVTAGMEYVDAINRGEPPASPSRILQASVAADNKAPPPPGSYAAPAQKEITVDDLNAPLNP
ncbi:peptidylprolyl isomerase [Parasphingorhabdus halotolerans]|uniref:Peptidyl-prolyl cis-trans isomerase n=1 Tax=Parasphingorhabdus halotolerans TaxID=2725558 RepID=A0A6H2DLQ6_9SPHN|nr:peptidylprolyl isomerase [Parasphingorhabdus halotolerans]QJB69320.1 peptidylprolyl isomerase [Parasphingorhabdus halotolerans]